MTNTKQVSLKADKQYTIIGIGPGEKHVSGRSAREALGVALKRGRHGLGSSWSMTRQKDGWIIVVQSASRTLERKMYKMRETNYNPTMKGNM